MAENLLRLTGTNGARLALETDDGDLDLFVSITPPGARDGLTAVLSPGHAWALYRYMERLKPSIITAVRGGAI